MLYAMACVDEGCVGEPIRYPFWCSRMVADSGRGGSTCDDVFYAHNEQDKYEQIQIAPEQYIEMFE